MLNRDGITRSTYGAPTQILANVELQSSVGCIVSSALGVEAGGKKIVKAGTPIKVDLMNLQTVAVAEGANAVLLHDVDVTRGNANGTALIFGFVNVNRVEADVATKLTAAATGLKGITLLKV